MLTPSLTRLRFKNWRSLKDAEIADLTPITVFIGANSSGKTNILDALHFLRRANEEGVYQAIQDRQGAGKIWTVEVPTSEAIELEFTFQPSVSEPELTYSLNAKYSNTPFPEVAERLVDRNGKLWLERGFGGQASIRGLEDKTHTLNDAPLGWDETLLSSYGRVPSYPKVFQTSQFITQRWQMLDENFMPRVSVPMDQTGDIYVIDRCAENVPIMLDFMYGSNQSLYNELQDDLRWLVSHVSDLQVEQTDRETRFVVHEKMHGGKEAPTISAGTARLLAMLTAYYALDVRLAQIQMPGLVVIEEPDTALNPWLLRNFVEQLRNYT